MKNIFPIISLSLLLCLVCACSEPTPDLMTADGVRASVQEAGAYNTLRLMAQNDEKAWKNFYERVAAGEEKWLQLVPQVLGATDAGYSGGIVDALALALPKNPEGVLALEGSMVSMKQVCSIPFAEADEDFAGAYAQSVIRALDGVNDAYFEQDKRMCLLRLNESMDKIRQRSRGEFNFK